MSAVQLPRPVALSGVRLAVKLVPHGPVQAVKSFEPTAPHWLGPITPAGTLGSLSADGCPDSRRDISGSGPVSLKTFGLWQSSHPPSVTKYFPRSAGDSAGAA